jgi:hypothetical protein
VAVYHKLAVLYLLGYRGKAVDNINKATELAKETRYANGLTDCYLMAGKIAFLNSNYNK